MPAVFIAQATLTQWSDAGKVRLEDNLLHLVKEQRAVLLKPAVRFVKLIGGEADPNGLLGKVKTADQLRELGAEHYMDSVLLGDVAYEVVEGFMGDLQAPASPKATPAAVPATAAASDPQAATPHAAAPQAAAAPHAAASQTAAPQTAAPPAAAAPHAAAPPAAAVPQAAAPHAAAPHTAAPRAPAPVEVTPAPAPGGDPEGDVEDADAQELSRLFLDTVR